MDEKEREELLALKRTVRQILINLDNEIIKRSPKDSDELFNFRVRKAIYYRDIIKQIDAQLRED